MILQLGSTKSIAVKKNPFSQSTENVDVSEVNVTNISDNCVNTVTAVIIVSVGTMPLKLVLWEDASYDAIGNWTQAQAEARIIELL